MSANDDVELAADADGTTTTREQQEEAAEERRRRQRREAEESEGDVGGGERDFSGLMGAVRRGDARSVDPSPRPRDDGQLARGAGQVDGEPRDDARDQQPTADTQDPEVREERTPPAGGFARRADATGEMRRQERLADAATTSAPTPDDTRVKGGRTPGRNQEPGPLEARVRAHDEQLRESEADEAREQLEARVESLVESPGPAAQESLQLQRELASNTLADIVGGEKTVQAYVDRNEAMLRADAAQTLEEKLAERGINIDLTRDDVKLDEQNGRVEATLTEDAQDRVRAASERFGGTSPVEDFFRDIRESVNEAITGAAASFDDILEESQVAEGLELAVSPTGEVIEQQTNVSAVETEELPENVESVTRGAVDIAVSTPIVLIEAGEFVKAGVEATGESVLNTEQAELGMRTVPVADTDPLDRFGEKTIAAGAEKVDQTVTAFQERPKQTSLVALGSLIGSGALIGGATRFLGARTGRAVAFGVQPGEELAITAARAGAITGRTARLVPGVRQGHLEATADTDARILDRVRTEATAARFRAAELREIGVRSELVRRIRRAQKRLEFKAAELDPRSDVEAPPRRGGDRGQLTLAPKVETRTETDAEQRLREAQRSEVRTEADRRTRTDIRVEPRVSTESVVSATAMMQAAQAPSVNVDEEITADVDTRVDTDIDSRVDTNVDQRVESRVDVATEPRMEVEQRLDQRHEQRVETRLETRVATEARAEADSRVRESGEGVSVVDRRPWLFDRTFEAPIATPEQFLSGEAFDVDYDVTTDIDVGDLDG